MKKILLKILVALLIVLVSAVMIVQLNFSAEQKKTYEAAKFSISEQVAKADVNLGKRLYSVRSGCIECHGSDLTGVKVMDNGAMGLIYGANITPHMLSSWSDEEIARAIRYGIHKTGRSLQFMPSFDYEGLSLGDIAALVAYVKSVPAVQKPGHENTFGPVAKTLSMLGQMPVMFPAKVMNLQKGFGEKPEEGPTKAFGQYLANSCVGCHGAEFRGGKIPGGDPAWPEAANIRLGSKAGWTEDTFKNAILTGISPSTKAKFRYPMPIGLLAQMNETEVKALWEYLSSLK